MVKLNVFQVNLATEPRESGQGLYSVWNFFMETKGTIVGILTSERVSCLYESLEYVEKHMDFIKKDTAKIILI